MIKAVDVSELGVILVPNAGLDEHVLPPGTYQKAGEREAYAIAGIGGNPSFPKRLGHHPEHLATVEAERTIGERVDFKMAEIYKAALGEAS